MARALRPHEGLHKKGLTSLLSLREEMDRLFDDWFNEPRLGVSLSPLRALEDREGLYMPRVDVTENDKEIRIAAELPGIEEKDIDISVSTDAITIKGEKSEEKEEKGEKYQWQERFFGSFERTIPFSCDVDADKATAEYKRGILRVTLPKTEREKQKVHKLNVKIA